MSQMQQRHDGLTYFTVSLSAGIPWTATVTTENPDKREESEEEG